MDIRVKYMEFCGIAECEAWLSHMAHNKLETVRIKTPVSPDFLETYPNHETSVMDYTRSVFEAALDLM